MLYHTSTNISLKKKCFIPRIPPYRLAKEDMTIKRVSSSNSIKNCIASFPYKHELINYVVPTFLAVYAVDETTFQPGEIKYPEEVQSYVEDAIKRQEHWIMKDFIAQPTLIKIKKIRFSGYCKYTETYSGDVTELEYEKDIEFYDRVEKATFYHREHFREFQKVCAMQGIEIQEVVEEKKKMSYGFYGASTKIYTVKTVTYKIPSGISVNPAWDIIAKELRKNKKKHTSYYGKDFI